MVHMSQRFPLKVCRPFPLGLRIRATRTHSLTPNTRQVISHAWKHKETTDSTHTGLGFVFVGFLSCLRKQTAVFSVSSSCWAELKSAETECVSGEIRRVAMTTCQKDLGFSYRKNQVTIR